MRNRVTAVLCAQASLARFSLSRAAKGLLCTLLLLSVLPPVRAYTAYLAPAFIFRGDVNLVDSFDQAYADLVAYWDAVEDFDRHRLHRYEPAPRADA